MPITVFTQSQFELPDGSEMRSYFDTPEAGGGSPFPLVVIMGGGPGDASIASSAFRSHGEAFLDHGWAVAAPVSPNGKSFWGANAEKVEQLISIIKQREEIDKGPVLLTGISNGGISALDIASRNPGEYRGVIAVPAIASHVMQLGALRDFPVYLRIGSEDRIGWSNRFETTVGFLTKAGVNLNARLLTGIGHTFPLDWDDLEPWLETLDRE